MTLLQPPAAAAHGVRNPLLLLTLAAVAAAAARPGLDLGRATGLDPLELMLALATAEKRGFIARSGDAFSLTQAGLRWAAAELRPLADLRRASADLPAECDGVAA